MSSKLTITANNTNWLDPMPPYEGPIWKTPKKAQAPSLLVNGLTEMQCIIEELQSSHDSIKKQLMLVEACLRSLEGAMQSSNMTGFATAGSSEVQEARDEMSANLMNLASLKGIVARIQLKLNEEQIAKKTDEADNIDIW